MSGFDLHTPITRNAVRPPPRPPIQRLVEERGWFALDADGIIRCPLLVKGEVIGPEPIDRAAIERAFAALDRGRTSADPYATHATIGKV